MRTEPRNVHTGCYLTTRVVAPVPDHIMTPRNPAARRELTDPATVDPDNRQLYGAAGFEVKA